MKKLFLLIVLLIVSFNIVLAQEININDKFKANYSVNSGDYPNLFINYDTVNGYVLLKIYYKKNNQENCGFLKLNSNSYDKYNGDTFYFESGVEECRMDIYFSESPFDEYPSGNPDFSTGWISF